MNKVHFDKLVTILNDHFRMNKARMECLSGMIIALLQVRTISIPHLSTYFPSAAKISSRQRRIHRFIKEVHIEFNHVAEFIMNLFHFKEKEIYLSIDRTNWKYGLKNINFLVLAVVYKGAAVPIYWLLLNKKGNSNTRERIAILKRFTKQFKDQKILGVLGDREFIGDDWLSWLNNEDITYYMRIRKNQITNTISSKETRVENLFHDLTQGQTCFLRKKRRLGHQTVYLSGLRLEDNELLIIASNVKSIKSIEIYGKRWEIETLFSDMKGRGFHIEDTRVTKLNRLKKLFLVPVIAFCWSHKCGDYKDKFLPIKKKNHGRLVQSFFRYGLDMIASELFNIASNSEENIQKILSFICCSQQQKSLE